MSIPHRLVRFSAAEQRYLRQFLADLPTAEEYAKALNRDAVELLTSEKTIVRGSYCATEPVAAALRPLGLVECRGRHLTVFGTEVRRVLIEGEA